MIGRIPIMNVSPVVDLGRLPAKATIGEPLPISASVFREGHDALGAEVVLIGPDGIRRAPVPMTAHPTIPDRYDAWVTPDAEGAWSFEILGWSHPLATWRHAAGLKIPAGVDVELMFTEARLLFERVLAGENGLEAIAPADQWAATALRGPSAAQAAVLHAAIAAATDDTRPDQARAAAVFADDVTAVLNAHPIRELLTVGGPFPLYADRVRALYGSWYEFFPRSEGAKIHKRTGQVISGNFKTAAKRLDAVAQMGFDVVYLPPIHPIGEVNRKGPNNTLTPGPEDPGSPWAIGSQYGGHDTVHPVLGTEKDFAAFVRKAKRLGMEVALDLALQAAPDHPWVTTHPEWFTTRADGTIAYAENPPKKYQDIYPINFDNDPDGIAAEVLRVVRHWMSLGVRIFRVDNPHTKPLEFWQWLLGEVRATDPDVLFLSEAFTKPPMMHGLGAIGYHQSYTYFTWRTGKAEIEDYLVEVSQRSAHLMRPNFFVNTPDILHASLQYGGPAMFKIRAVLAATGSPSWGVYAGYELYEHVAVKPGSEEYLDSEKYQIRVRDWEGAAESGRTLAPYLTQLNEIRRRHPALQLLRNLELHSADDDHTIVFSKRATSADGGSDTVIVVLNLDPHATRATTVHLNLPALGLDWQDRFLVHDELTGQQWTWGEHNYVQLDPGQEVAHILSVRRF